MKVKKLKAIFMLFLWAATIFNVGAALAFGYSLLVFDFDKALFYLFIHVLCTFTNVASIKLVLLAEETAKITAETRRIIQETREMLRN